MSEGVELEETARRRLRTLRQARGWTLDDLAARAHLGASTISRIETGQRRLAVDQLVTLARALGITVDDLLAADEGDDVVIRPTPYGPEGGAVWVLSRRDDPSGRVVAKSRLPPGTTAEPEQRVHPGHDWFYVLVGTARLVLGGREHIVTAGQPASFSTMHRTAWSVSAGPRRSSRSSTTTANGPTSTPPDRECLADPARALAERWSPVDARPREVRHGRARAGPPRRRGDRR